ncbi:MAG: hypothetical protein LBQ34_04275 [Alphaproteobacteria bacterium]|jgi:hypothetical protein|nr:hypothetical protein [Alphaproteobacteria bacterium]
MFKIQYDLESFKNDLVSLKKAGGGRWDHTVIDDEDDGESIELNLDDDDFGDAGFFEVKENGYNLEFRFFFYDSVDKSSKEDDEKIYSYFYSQLVEFILAKIIKSGEKISIIKS